MKEILGFFLIGLCLVLVIGAVQNANVITGIIGGIGFAAGIDFIVSSKTNKS